MEKNQGCLQLAKTNFNTLERKITKPSHDTQKENLTKAHHIKLLEITEGEKS